MGEIIGDAEIPFGDEIRPGGGRIFFWLFSSGYGIIATKVAIIPFHFMAVYDMANYTIRSRSWYNVGVPEKTGMDRKSMLLGGPVYDRKSISKRRLL